MHERLRAWGTGESKGALWTAYALALSVIAVAALVFRSRFYPELGYDESASILGQSILSGHFGNHPDPWGPLGFQRHYVMDCYPPVYYLAQAVVFKLTGFGIIPARVTSALFVGATAFLCFWGGRRVAGPAAGFLAMAIYMMVPVKVYTIVARPDVAVPFFLLGSLLVLALTAESGGRTRYLLAGVLCALAALSHFVALMAVPVVVALLWYRAGRRFWRSDVTWMFALGAVIPLLGYAVLLYPHYLPTLHHLIRYSDVGLASAANDLWDRWPLRPTLQHLRHVQAHLPWLLYLVLPAALVVAALGLRVSAVRSRVTTVGWLLCACLLGVFVMVGAYPNIAVYGYYGPVYLALASVVAGYCLLLPLPGNWPRRNVVVAAGAAAATAMTAAVIQAAARSETDARGIPLVAALEWTFEFPRLAETKVLASPHWVFSSAADRVRTPGILALEAGKPIVSRAYQREVAGAGELGDYGAVIFDKWNEYHVLQRLVEFGAKLPDPPGGALRDPHKEAAAQRLDQKLRFLAAYVGPSYSTYSPLDHLAVASYRIAGVFRDDVRISADYSIFELGAPAADSSWSRLARATPGGAEPLTVSAECSASLSGSRIPGASPWTPWLTTHAIALEAVPEIRDNLLAVRVVLSPAFPAEPLGFAAYYPDRDSAAAARRDLAEYRAPALSTSMSLGLLGFRLGEGKVGREMLVQPGATGSGGMLTIHQTEPRSIERIDIAVALPPGAKCDASLADALRRIVDRSSKPPPPAPGVRS